jgi:hypothetical protein
MQILMLIWNQEKKYQRITPKDKSRIANQQQDN